MNHHSTLVSLSEILLQHQLSMVTAESCTGGAIAATVTSMSGSSSWFDSGLVTYSNDAKEKLLGISKEIIEKHGAVSNEVVSLMAKNVARLRNKPVSIAVSGIAGPNGGTPEKPVGTVWMGWSVCGKLTTELFLFQGDRAQIQSQAVEKGLVKLLFLLREEFL